MYRIGIDVGGTFTDLVAIDEGGLTTLAKVPSTPDDPSLGVLDGLSQLAGRLGLNRTTLLRDTDRVVHGTTVATNALLEHKGARTGLLVTQGFGAIYPVGEQSRPYGPAIFDVMFDKPAVLVPEPDRRGQGARRFSRRRPVRARRAGAA